MTLTKHKEWIRYIAFAAVAVLLYHFYKKWTTPTPIHEPEKVKPTIPNIQFPELDLNKNWTIQPATADAEELLKFHVWNKSHIAPAVVTYDHEKQVWEIPNKSKTYEVPLDDTQQLRAVIALVLQDISPIKP